MDSVKLAEIIMQKKEAWINSTQPLAYTLAIDLKRQIEELITENNSTESTENINAATLMVQELDKVLNTWKTNIISILEVKHERVKAARTYAIAHVFSTSLDLSSMSGAAKQLREELSHTLKTHKNKMMFHDSSLFAHIVLLINDVLEKLGIKQRLNTKISFFGTNAGLKQGIDSLEKSLQVKEKIYEYTPEVQFKGY
ncbi:MAG: hypothetical protein J0I93_08350 [Legionella sp.]|nr:hypothetical protein [Legionella sp.]